jgi:hypothetical protein
MMESDNYELNALLIENEHLKVVNKDLLKVLEALNDAFEGNKIEFPYYLIERTKAAIAKARGE